MKGAQKQGRKGKKPIEIRCWEILKHLFNIIWTYSICETAHFIAVKTEKWRNFSITLYVCGTKLTVVAGNMKDWAPKDSNSFLQGLRDGGISAF